MIKHPAFIFCEFLTIYIAYGDLCIMNEEKDLVPIEIDLGVNRRGELNESWLAMFGGAVESLMKAMFGGGTVPVTVRGTRSEVNSFASVLGKEKSYMKAYKKHGLNDPVTYKSKYKLDRAVKGFEKITGIKWPFK